MKFGIITHFNPLKPSHDQNFDFWATVCKRVRPMLSDHCPVLSPCPVCLSVTFVGALWPSGWMDQDETWHGVKPLPRPHCVRWGPSFPPPPQKGDTNPQFLADVCCGQTAGWIKMPLGMEVGLGPGQIVRWGPSPPKEHSPQFSAHVCCGQGAAWIQMPLGMEVELSPAHIVLG